MITFTSGNMFDTPADIRINTVNCVGVMGAGLALAFKTKYPEMFREYQKACKAGEVKPGKLHVWNKLFGDCIINFPTKRHWREPSRYEDIEAGLIALRKYLADKGKVKVLLPAVGCGHGGLEWNRISEMIKKQLADVESEIIVFTPEDSRAAGNKIKDHEDTQIQDRLDAEGIKVIEPGNDLYPESIRGRTAAKLYIKGDPKKLNSPLLTILPSPKPTPQEIDAAATTVETIMRPGITLLIGYGASIERPAIKKALEKGSDVVVILSEGILDFRVRKDLLDVWDDNRIVVISATKPLERWSPSTAFRAKDLQLSLANAAIITDAEPQSLSKMLVQKASQKHPFIYYVDYGKKDATIINTFKTIKAQRLAVNDLSEPKHYEAIFNILGVNELKQPTSERNTEAISTPIAEHHITNEGKTRSIKEPEVEAMGGTGYPKRLIEVDLPIKRISEHARREKSIRFGHVSTLHIWWARRPLASCRAIICAALWPDPADPNCPLLFKKEAAALMKEFRNNVGGKPRNVSNGIELRDALLDFIADFSNWDNSVNSHYLKTSKALTQIAYASMSCDAKRPFVVDPFAGGGAIPLEALRAGAEAFASDINPLAVLLNKVMLEYVPQFGEKLADEVEKWGAWVKEQSQKELSEYYPKDPDGSLPVAYIWARTINCEGPKCGAEIPLIRSLWLSKGAKHSIALKIIPNSISRKIDFQLLCDAKSKDIAEGTVRRGSVTCPLCGYTTPVASVREQLKKRGGGASDARLIAVVTTRSNYQGRSFRLPEKYDFIAVEKAKKELDDRKQRHKGLIPLIPNEILPLMSGVFNAPIYGHDTWGSLFTQRQSLILAELIKQLSNARQKFMHELPQNLAIAVHTVLSLGISRIADIGNSLCIWKPSMSQVIHVFTRQAIPMLWDFAESSPLSDAAGDYKTTILNMVRILRRETMQYKEGHVEIASATLHPLPDDSADAIITDPPYYNAVPYADLSDFFYVWLKRCLQETHPSLFSTELAPKDDEICEMAGWDSLRYSHKDKQYFESQMTKAMVQCRRILKPNGIGVVVFAHKTTSGWEAQLQAMINAGWTITGSWPIDTELANRLRARNSAVLSSSIHIVCRPRENPDGSLITDTIGDWRDVLSELPKRIHDWMPRLAAEGVVGADAIFACLGPALEIYSRYSRVEKANGEQVTLKEYLEQVWAVVAKEALNVIFEGADTTGFEEDARLTAMWLWTLSTGSANVDASSSDTEEDEEDEEKSPKVKLSGYMLEYDAARKIAQGLGAHLEHLQSLIEVKGDKARLLPVSERTKTLFGKDESEAPATRRKKKTAQLELGFIEEIEKVEQEGSWGQKNVPQLGNTRLDRLHQSMILFAAGRGEALKRFLVEEGVGQDQKFWRLAQALSALYPSISDEKRWVDGVLARKKGFGF